MKITESRARDGKTQWAREVAMQFDGAVGRFRLAIEDVPEQLGSALPSRKKP
jgi:hypothetical protein